MSQRISFVATRNQSSPGLNGTIRQKINSALRDTVVRLDDNKDQRYLSLLGFARRCIQKVQRVYPKLTRLNELRSTTPFNRFNSIGITRIHRPTSVWPNV